MEKRIYLGEFSGWPDVVSNYGNPCPEAEPSFVIATYDYESYEGSSYSSYEGSSTVIISNDGIEFEVVEGSHCSCYGLEDQWKTTTHSAAEIRKMMGATYGFFDRHRATIANWLEDVGASEEPTKAAA